MKNIILASASPRRAELLRLLNLEYKVIPSYKPEAINEKLKVDEVVQTLAYEKAADIEKQLEYDALIIGADTVVVKNGILGKPKDIEHAFAMLQRLQGQWHEVFTGVAVIDSATKKFVLGYERTCVKMKQLSEEKINSYIKTGEPMDKAGSYGIQGMGSIFIERIEGCYFNVVGLPLMKLSNMMEELGVNIL
jgi:septum formation protein